MKLIALVLCVATLALAAEKYEKYEETFNLQEILENDRLRVAYMKCLLNKGPCTPEAKNIKDKLPEILETNCAKCSSKQKEMARALIRHVNKTHPETWHEFRALYDPQVFYTKAFQELLEE